MIYLSLTYPLTRFNFAEDILLQLRRDEIKPSLKAEYSTIYSAEVPISSQYLSGDDLAKQLRDAKEASKISHSFAATSKNGPYRGRQRNSHQNDHYSKGPKKHFLWKGQQRPYKKKKNHRTTTRNNGTAASTKIHGKWIVIPTVPNKLRSEGAQGVVVLLDWPTQAWYPVALQLLKQKPVYLKARKDLLQLPIHPREIHPIWHKLNLLVCLLSGKD